MKKYFIFLPLLVVICHCANTPTDGYLFPIEEGGHWGFIDVNGVVQIPCEYSDVYEVQNGYVSAENFFGSYRIDTKSKKITRIDKSKPIPIKKTTLFDKSGKPVFIATERSNLKGGFYTYTQYLHHDSIARTHFVDKQGVIQYTLSDSLSIRGYSEGVFKLEVSEPFDWLHAPTIYMDTTFKELFRIQAIQTSNFKEGLACIHYQGYVNKKGDFVFKNPYVFRDFSEQRVAVFNLEKKLAGYLDTLGNVVIDYQFEGGASFHEGLAAVQDARTNLYGFIDKDGKWAIPPEYTDIPGSFFCHSCNLHDYPGFFHGLALVCKNDKWGYINKQGKVVWWQKN